MSGLQCEADVLGRQCTRTTTEHYASATLCAQHAAKLARDGRIKLHPLRHHSRQQWVERGEHGDFIFEMPKPQPPDDTIERRRI